MLTQRYSLCRKHYICDNGCRPGGPNVALKNPKIVEVIEGDGNCLFRELPMQSLGQNLSIIDSVAFIVEHLRSFIGTDKELRILGSIIEDDTIDDYIDCTQIVEDGAWGGDIEMALISHKLRITTVIRTCLLLR